MGVVAATSVRLSTVTAGHAARIDPHHFGLMPIAEAAVSGLNNGIRLGPPIVQSIANGSNLQEGAYDYSAEDPTAVYASVGAISQYSIRLDRAVPLKEETDFDYRTALTGMACTDADLLVSRSGTPGVAWPAREAFVRGLPMVIPSGFVVRLRLDTDAVNPMYLAGVLNHPVWRAWTSALAAGKRQRNISQEQLEEVCVPMVPREVQDALATKYQAFLDDIYQLRAGSQTLRAKCDEILRQETALQVLSLRLSAFSVDRTRLSAVASGSAGLRVDPRYFRGEVRAVLAPLGNVATVPLRSFLSADLIKGRQPVILTGDDEEDAGPRVVSTASIQGGAVVDGLTKPTTEDEIAAAGRRQLQEGDLLITMDGEGSIGKAAVYRAPFDAVCDSHVAILRLDDTDLAPALACYLNGSLGQAQIELVITGATGQTQISKPDLLGLRVPAVVAERGLALGQSYGAMVAAHEDGGSQLRRALCRVAREFSEGLATAGTFTEAAGQAVLALSERDLAATLERVRVATA
jgi:hypothetical protein